MPALLVGAPTRDLVGTDVDLDGMSTLVETLGLGPARVLPRATLGQIRRELTMLVHQAGAGDRIVIYLTGHGGVVINTAHGLQDTRPLPQRLHYFATMHDEDDPGGVLSEPELSLWCTRLADRTANIVVIVDTCHASGLVRDAHDAEEVLDAFQLWRVAHQDELDALDGEAHPSVVRLSAAGVHGVARPGPEGSALTRALLATLREQGAADASWLALFPRIEHHLALDGAAQQPRLSGPIRRRVFELAEAMSPGALAVQTNDEGHWTLAGGAQQGIASGDLFMISSVGGEYLAQVNSVSPTRSTLVAHGPPCSDHRVTSASFAVPLYIRRVATPHATRRLASASETREHSFTAVDRLQALGGTSLAALGLRSSWGRVHRSSCETLQSPGATLGPADPLFVRIENTGTDRRFVSVFWVGADGDIAVLSRSESMGVELAGRTCYLLGDRPFARAPCGVLPPRRPFPPGEERRESLVIVASPHRQNLWNFDLHGASPAQRDASLTATEMLHFTVTSRQAGRP